MKKSIVLALLAVLCLFEYVRTSTPDQDPYRVTDYSRLHPVKVERVAQGKEEKQLIALVREASEKGLRLSIAGQRHSQGGHTYYKDAIVLDMTSYNRILELDPEAKTVRVQAGATWGDVQRAVQPSGLAVRTMQSQNIFTVGGSISINAHGRDIRNGSMIGSVESFRLLTADGEIRSVSRTEQPELFSAVLGGYGLFGVITDVTLRLTDDEMYRMTTEQVEVDRYAAYFREHVMADPDVRMHIARLSVAPDHFLQEMYAINYTVDGTSSPDPGAPLQSRERFVGVKKLLFQLNRSGDWGKNAYWDLQQSVVPMQQGKRISRNNAMGSESAFMEYRQPGANDLLQEYFIPVDRFGDFVASLRTVLSEERMNLLNITVRYVGEDREPLLAYAKEDMFALVCLFHVSLSEHAQNEFQRGVQRIVDAALALDGTYYLPYAPYATKEQFQRAYPQQETFWALKDKYDPQGLFMNQFYEQYEGGE
ncbi:FAD-binding oxidoreductase [Paenibacillus hodogayensis]